MKALRSPRLNNLLRDPIANERLRRFIAESMAGQTSTVRELSVQHPDGSETRYCPKLVGITEIDAV